MVLINISVYLCGSVAKKLRAAEISLAHSCIFAKSGIGIFNSCGDSLLLSSPSFFAATLQEIFVYSKRFIIISEEL